MTLYVSHDWLEQDKIRAIKAVRAATGAGLKEAKDIVDRAQSEVRLSVVPLVVDPASAQPLAAEITLAGGQALIVDSPDSKAAERKRAVAVCEALLTAYERSDLSAVFALGRAIELIKTGWKVEV